ncbi:VapC toxin family PIN domain ribonuclease [Candidatus Roizmanbacteria bacterium CG_4_9_14_0_2_um_filter_39_13]|uniref:Ribonuclease VapC n=1 Tax=Candidatus Roizmanbacteria bacterium CG_4_9_14_0_2_um_filter_39_13 TaxID=1974839 RepID=A0A2M8F4J7_9BACT|nr:MAG: VapC toxin family PIN domain ribonuclease [Candidatus Roizmanbacteria bacterium CG_4_10_14_0_2_um_filter_39_12]PJC34215.1 MAG: VapC toxin family PIN domain ribonuclease [Candidatus Roizmanbacteria bacterium CG_4_9_14_0_2_um_filter_39_13]
MSYIVDTDVLINVSHNVEADISFVRQSRTSYISVITATELLHGVRNNNELEITNKLIDHYNILHINEQISEQAYQLVKSYFLSHSLLINDALIAATAIHYGYTLVTHNIKHFKVVAKLKLHQPV